VSVIGNDDIPIAQHIPVKLTTIRAPMFDMGMKAAQILIRNIDAARSLPVENVAMEAELIVRQSTRTL
jgi:LacI family transcriptional regulator